jgi:hypothetical protein
MQKKDLWSNGKDKNMIHYLIVHFYSLTNKLIFKISEEKKNTFHCLKHGPVVKQIKQNVQIFDGVVI